jgi:hypothetical protein
MIAIQQAPEWLRPLHLILPVSRLRPIDKMVSGDIKRNDEVDSPHDENGGNRGGHCRKSAPLYKKRLAQTGSGDYPSLVLEIILRECKKGWKSLYFYESMFLELQDWNRLRDTCVCY